MSETTLNPPAPGPGRCQFALVSCCFLLSGFAALLYQTVWLRQFSILLGTSEQALAVILASYMGGLAIGSAIASRFVDRITRPLLTYGLLEAGIALTALAVPVGLELVHQLQAQWFGGAPEPRAAGSPGQVAFALGSAFALVILPTAMMGATLPLLTKHVVRDDQSLGGKVSILYAINTAGAVIGTLTAAFLCLPKLGLAHTTWIGVAANFGVFGLVCLMAKGLQQPGGSAPADRMKTPRATSADPAGRRYRHIVWLSAASGAVSFCYEIVFTRLLGHILGGSIFAFATMLAGFLLGITIGSAIAAKFSRNRRMAALGFAIAQCAAALASLFAFRTVDWMASWPPSDTLGGTSLLDYVTSSILVLLPTAVCIGATFPFAIRVLASDETEAARASARIFFWNTAGGIGGALVTGGLILPALGYEDTALVAILGNLALGAATLLLLVRSRTPKFAIALAAATAVLVIVFRPPFPEHVFYRSGLGGHRTPGKLTFTKVGRSGTVALFDQQGHTQVRTNGLPEATVVRPGSPMTARSSAIWLAALPTLVRPEGDSMLIVGLGGGVAASYTPPSVKHVDVFELEPAIVDANRLIAPHRDRDPLADPRVSIILNDGRNGLHLTTKKYHHIVSQPSHPWTAGGSHLFTREFATIAREHLEPGGIFLQWMAAEFIDVPLLRSMVATLAEVFPHVRLYTPAAGQLLFVASMAPIEPEKTTDASSFIPEENRAYFRELGIITPSDLYATLRLDSQSAREFSAGAEPVTDNLNGFAFERSNSRSEGTIGRIDDQLAKHRPIMRPPEETARQCPTLDIAAALKLKTWGFSRSEIETLEERIDDPVDRLIRVASTALSSGDRDGWAATLTQACEDHPDDPRPAFMLLADHFIGTRYPLSIDQKRHLGSLLDDPYGRLVEGLKARPGEHLRILREHDATLAAFTPDDPAFAIASRLRCYWRISAEDPELHRLAIETIAITDADAPYLNGYATTWFRTVGAIRSGQSHKALASTQDLADGIRTTLISGRGMTLASFSEAVNTLGSCREEIKDFSRLDGVTKESHEEVLAFVDKVAAKAQQFIDAAKSRAAPAQSNPVAP